ncbi:MAG: cutinase family protein [Solirubrobacterales bacterium]
MTPIAHDQEGTRARWLGQAVIALVVLTLACLAVARPASADSFPVLNILSPVSGSTISQGPINFAYSTSDGTPPISVICQIDNGANGVFDPCASSFSVAYLPDGIHSFLVQVTDGAGNQMTSVTMFMTSLPAPPPDDPPTSERCPSVKLLGLRGSGEPSASNNGLGNPVGNFNAELKSQLGNSLPNGFATVPIPYPAVAANWYELLVAGGIGNQSYASSVSAGVDDLASVLENDPCNRESKYVLAGYSQGAQVIGDAIESGRLTTLRKRVVATVMFGDPKWDTSLTGTAFKSTYNGQPSSVGALGGRANKDLFVGYHARSFCRMFDPVCQRDTTRLIQGSFDEHTHYGGANATNGPEATWAATLVANQLKGQPSSVTAQQVSAGLDGDDIHVSCTLPGRGVCQTQVLPSYKFGKFKAGIKDGSADDRYRFVDYVVGSGPTHRFASPFPPIRGSGKYTLTLKVITRAIQVGAIEHTQTSTFEIPVP